MTLPWQLVPINSVEGLIFFLCISHRSSWKKKEHTLKITLAIFRNAFSNGACVLNKWSLLDQLSSLDFNLNVMKNEVKNVVRNEIKQFIIITCGCVLIEFRAGHDVINCLQENRWLGDRTTTRQFHFNQTWKSVGWISMSSPRFTSKPRDAVWRYVANLSCSLSFKLFDEKKKLTQFYIFIFKFLIINIFLSIWI